ncbi:MFS transporter [Epidermidibacterium keratini]|uniref:MFS transporter n=1 Tax=Epidermidibacterium keratini TaxID=1891644 RepID=UPI001CEF8671|nr:MFS transporter [Epidermidibacterium keratini]
MTQPPDFPQTAEATAPPLALHRDANFRRFWFGEAISQFGIEVGVLALPVIAVTLLDATESQVGYLNAAAFAAFLFVGLPAGAWVDRWNKRSTMIRANALRFAATLAVPALWFAGVLAMWQLYVLAALIGIGRVFFDVCYQSYIPFLVRPSQVSDANSKLESTAQIARMGGPALGGLLLKFISAPVLMIIDAVGYLASILALRGVNDDEQPHDRAQQTRLVADIREGLAFVAQHRIIRAITMCTGISNFFGTMLMTLVSIYVLRLLDFSPAVLGFIVGAGAVGGLLGAVSARHIGEYVGEGRTIPLAALLIAPAMALVPTASYLPERWMQIGLLVVSEALFGFGVIVYNVIQVSMRQRACPKRLLGRMNASIRFFVWGVMPLGALAGGWLGEAIGVVATLWIAVAGQALAALPVIASPLRSMREFPDPPAD